MSQLTRRALMRAGALLSARLACPHTLDALSPAGTGLNPNASQQWHLDLAGDWRFYRDDEKRGIAERWYSDPLPIGLGPQSIHLPGTTDQAHAGISNPDQASLSGLYRPNTYVGPAWYQREIEISDSWLGKSLTLLLERVHWTTHAWMDGIPLGTHESLVAPHVYDLGTHVTPGRHVITLCVDNTILYDLGRFASVYYEGTQTNWNGIIGRIDIVAHDPVHVQALEVYPDIDRQIAKIRANVRNASPHAAAGSVQVRVLDSAGAVVGASSAAFSLGRESMASIDSRFP